MPDLAQQNESTPKARVRDQLAQEAGVSKMVYSALKTVNEKGSEELKEAVLIPAAGVELYGAHIVSSRKNLSVLAVFPVIRQ